MTDCLFVFFLLGSHKGTSKKDRQKENPFSFKKFLSSGSAAVSKGTNSTSASSEYAVAESSNFLSDQTQVNGRIKDHVSILSGSSSEDSAVSDSFPIEAIDKKPLASLDLTTFPNIKDKSASSFQYFRYHDSDDTSESDGALTVIDSAPSVPLALPDFLSDAATINSRQPGLGAAGDRVMDGYEDLLDQIRTVSFFLCTVW